MGVIIYEAFPSHYFWYFLLLFQFFVLLFWSLCPKQNVILHQFLPSQNHTRIHPASKMMPALSGGLEFRWAFIPAKQKADYQGKQNRVFNQRSSKQSRCERVEHFQSLKLRLVDFDGRGVLCCSIIWQEQHWSLKKNCLIKLSSDSSSFTHRQPELLLLQKHRASDQPDSADLQLRLLPVAFTHSAVFMFA